MIKKEQKTNIVQEYRQGSSDTGSVEVQVALLTAKINSLTKHLEQFRKDNSSKRGLQVMVSRRKKFLDYLHHKNPDRYKNLIQRLGLRK